jgi:hypothetical protein
MAYPSPVQSWSYPFKAPTGEIIDRASQPAKQIVNVGGVSTTFILL